MAVSSGPELIQLVSTVVLAAFTAVLAVVTWMYYRQSKYQTNEMKKTRELRYEPKMKAGLRPFGPNFEIGFVNIGGGIAHEVQAEYWVEGVDQFKRDWGTAIHFPDDIQRIGIPLDDSPVGVVGMSEEIESKLNGGSDTFVVKWHYKNTRGDEFEQTNRFSLIEEIEAHSESTEYYTGDERNVKF